MLLYVHDQFGCIISLITYASKKIQSAYFRRFGATNRRPNESLQCPLKPKFHLADFTQNFPAVMFRGKSAFYHEEVGGP